MHATSLQRQGVSGVTAKYMQITCRSPAMWLAWRTKAICNRGVRGMQIVRGFRSGILLCLIAIFACAIPALAQTDAARLQGVITDQSNALVPGAKVKVTDLATNRVLQTSSDA